MTASDEHDRRRAIDERGRNVLVEASAGTGKTTLVVERILALVAPNDGPPIPIARLAAITFTRKAAGELRVRTRQRMLALLATLPAESRRAAPLHRALAGLDTAELGTIHSFADRLLRRWPAQARLDPRYTLDDAPGRLVDECFERLVQAAEAGALRALLRDTPWEERGDEATETVLAIQRAGLALRATESEHRTRHGLDSLVAAFVQQRDVDVVEVALEDFDRAAFDRFADELLRRTDGVSTATRGGRWFVETAEILRRVRRETDAALLFRHLVPRLTAGPRGYATNTPRRRDDFPDDPRAWDLWKAFDRDTRTRGRVRDASLRDDLLAPLRRWLAIRVARLRPVVLHVYEQIKASHEVVDHVDLLLRLRDLLRDEPAIRREAQALYDHILVDEFQDTDPLQAEIIVYLCQRDGEDPAPGSLTLVGDPKQSIYRFRRADIEAYQHVVACVARAPHVSIRLAASWRSAPALVDWLNTRFAAILGAASAAGEVAHAPLLAGRTTGPTATVHAVTLDVGDARKAEVRRACEADAMARYLRWLVECSGTTIEDPITRRQRSLGYGDIAVLAVSTTQLRRLLHAFDRDRVPYAARGGTLFLADPLHRTFLLGLVALADRDDGVARAALLRPPFFALDLGESARRCAEDADDRWARANEVVRELRRRRFERSVGATARALLEDTAIGRVVASGPNGAQRLTGLRELCIQLEARGLDEQLDFDAAVERVRGWISRPRQLERPHPIDGSAVRVLTIHQAKGLEFPVVMLWDACATWVDRVRGNDAWFVQRDGQGWSLELDQLRSEHPPGLGLAEREQRMCDAERKRLVYVAATRARDVLVLPHVIPRDDATIIGRLLGDTPHPTVLVQPPHAASAPAAWYVEAAPPPLGRPPTTTRDAELARAWETARGTAGQGVWRPIAFTDARSPRVFWGKAGRFGQAFGSVVHAAIGAALAGTSPADAVVQASSNFGLRRHHAAAIADVERALATLAALGVERDLHGYRLEYPVAGASPTGELLAGYVDLVAMTREGPILLDFKTDTVAAAIPDMYSAQVRGYARVVAAGLGTVALRAGLLFTSDGSVHWLSSELDGAV